MHLDDVRNFTHMNACLSSSSCFWLDERIVDIPSSHKQSAVAFLRHFVLVFVNDILIFSSSWADHFRHVRSVLQLLQQHELLLK